MTAYQDRVNSERLARQAPAVKRAAKDILETLQSIEQCLYWALDPDRQGDVYWAANLIDHAHALLDQGHAYRAQLVANPPPAEPLDERTLIAK